MIRSLLVTLSLALSLLCSPAWAATDKAEYDARMGKARELIAITGMAKLSDQITTAMVGQIGQLVNNANPGHEAEVKEALEEYFLPEVRASMPEFMDAIAGIYATNFTVAEMDAVIDFYKTPIGIKMLNSLPTLTQQSMAVGQAWGQAVAQRASGKFIEALKKRGLNAPKQL